MAKTRNSRAYVLLAIKEMTSTLNGGIFYRLTWVCLDDLTRWEMDVQDNYRNYLKNGWRTIIKERKWGVYTGMQETGRITNLGINVLSADSKPECIVPIESASLAADVVLQEMEHQQSLQARTQFDNLFAPAY